MELHENILETLGNTPLVQARPLLPAGRDAGRQARVLQSRVERQGPHRHRDDRGRRSARASSSRAGRSSSRPPATPASASRWPRILKGYKLICTAADKISKEKVALLRALRRRGHHLPDERRGGRSALLLQGRPSGSATSRGPTCRTSTTTRRTPSAHYASTGPEIWRQTDGKVTHWVAGVGTGGTISGVAKYLKEQNPAIRVIGVDPVGSVYAYYSEHGKLPPAEQIHQYLIDGIGEDFMPTSVWWDYIDEVITVRRPDPPTMRCCELAQKEAIFTGSSGGAAAVAARQVAATAPEGSLVVTLFPDSGERYLSKLNEEWMREKGLLDATDSDHPGERGGAGA